MGLLNKLFGKKDTHEQKQNSRRVLLKKTSTMMDEQQFWHLIQNSLNESKSQDDQESWLIKELQPLPLEQIIGFRLRTDKLLYDTSTVPLTFVDFTVTHITIKTYSKL